MVPSSEASLLASHAFQMAMFCPQDLARRVQALAPILKPQVVEELIVRNSVDDNIDADPIAELVPVHHRHAKSGQHGVGEIRFSLSCMVW